MTPQEQLMSYDPAPARVLDERGEVVGEVVVVVHAKTHQFKIEWRPPRRLADKFPLPAGRYTIQGFEVIG